ncbi:hypothetical protein [Emcibacter sp. SYSU 3D8]|uniref:hypothetical protein n=1 Tax=Emcibacter sp. SYSU 3D8 TaxID=3133969 RepID=UPI0031FE73B8
MIGIAKGTALFGLAVALAGCGVVYKPEVLTSGCISAARALGEPITGGKVDTHSWGPGQSQIDFITQDSEEPRRIVVRCTIDGDGELDQISADGQRIEGEPAEAARKAFSDIARSPAWNNQ